MGGPNIPTCGYGLERPSWLPQEFAVTRYILRGCRRCGGDLLLHDQYHRKDDWQCMQCGRYRHRQPVDPASDDPAESRLFPISNDSAPTARKAEPG